MAYHLTWTTYGTWLRGDRRGYVGRTLLGGQAVAPNRNQFGTPYDADHGRTYNYDANAMKGPPVRLTPEQAACAADALHEACDRAGYALLAAAVMSDHMHVLVAAHPDGKHGMMRRLKNVSAVRLTQAFGKPGRASGVEGHPAVEGACSTPTNPAAKAVGSNAAHPAAKAAGSKPESPSEGGRWWTRYGSYREIFDAAGMDAVRAYIAGQQDILAFVGENLPGLAARSGTAHPAAKAGGSLAAHPPAKAGGSLTQAEFGV